MNWKALWLTILFFVAVAIGASAWVWVCIRVGDAFGPIVGIVFAVSPSLCDAAVVTYKLFATADRQKKEPNQPGSVYQTRKDTR